MLTVRRFQAGEEMLLREVFHSAIHLIARAHYTQEQVDVWAPDTVDAPVWIERIRRINPFVATLNQTPVGYADVQLTGYIDHFFVSGHHPRMGIGRALMHAIEQEANHLKLRELTAMVSLTAQPFFQRFGFVMVEQRTPVVRGVAFSNALMRRVL
jgi:putative acetyltransferase